MVVGAVFSQQSHLIPHATVRLGSPIAEVLHNLHSEHDGIFDRHCYITVCSPRSEVSLPFHCHGYGFFSFDYRLNIYSVSIEPLLNYDQYHGLSGVLSFLRLASIIQKYSTKIQNFCQISSHQYFIIKSQQPSRRETKQMLYLDNFIAFGAHGPY